MFHVPTHTRITDGGADDDEEVGGRAEDDEGKGAEGEGADVSETGAVSEASTEGKDGDGGGIGGGVLFFDSLPLVSRRKSCLSLSASS
jgi:hypothetical protein